MSLSDDLLKLRLLPKFVECDGRKISIFVSFRFIDSRPVSDFSFGVRVRGKVTKCLLLIILFLAGGG